MVPVLARAMYRKCNLTCRLVTNWKGHAANDGDGSTGRGLAKLNARVYMEVDNGHVMIATGFGGAIIGLWIEEFVTSFRSVGKEVIFGEHSILQNVFQIHQ